MQGDVCLGWLFLWGWTAALFIRSGRAVLAHLPIDPLMIFVAITAARFW